MRIPAETASRSRYRRNFSLRSTTSNSSRSSLETRRSKLPSRADRSNFAATPVGVISAETRTPESRTALGTPLLAHRMKLVVGELHPLILWCRRDFGPELGESVEPQIPPKGFLDHLGIAFARPGGLDLHCSEDVLV